MLEYLLLGVRVNWAYFFPECLVLGAIVTGSTSFLQEFLVLVVFVTGSTSC